MSFRYVNAKGYFEDVANAVEEAKEEIFITDWWLVLIHETFVCVYKCNVIQKLGVMKTSNTQE